jgi:hypothetical protein
MPSIDLNARCRALALAVAALDDAGLPVEHKRVIATARKLRDLLRDATEADRRGGERDRPYCKGD